MTIAARSKKAESIVRRLRRPGSVSASSATRQECPADAAASSRFVRAVVVRTAPFATAPDR